MKKHITIRVNGLLIHVDRFHKDKNSNIIKLFSSINYIGYVRAHSLKLDHGFISTTKLFKGDKFISYTLKDGIIENV